MSDFIFSFLFSVIILFVIRTILDRLYLFISVQEIVWVHIKPLPQQVFPLVHTIDGRSYRFIGTNNEEATSNNAKISNTDIGMEKLIHYLQEQIPLILIGDSPENKSTHQATNREHQRKNYQD